MSSTTYSATRRCQLVVRAIELIPGRLVDERDQTDLGEGAREKLCRSGDTELIRSEHASGARVEQGVADQIEDVGVVPERQTAGSKWPKLGCVLK